MRNLQRHAAPLAREVFPALGISLALHAIAAVVLLGILVTPGARRSLNETRLPWIVLARSAYTDEVVADETSYANATFRAASIEAPQLFTAPGATIPPSEAAPAIRFITQMGPPAAKESTAAAPKSGSAIRALAEAGTNDYTKVSVFGVEGTGNKFVYVFDRSASMEGAPLAAAKRQLIASLKSLDTVHQFHIIFFNQRLKSMDITGGGRRIAFATDRNKQLATKFVGSVTADGGTDRFMALKRAIAFQPDVIFFLSDADDPMSSSEMAEIA
jgi:hypothetical protein